MSKLLYGNVTAVIRQSAFDVHSYFGNGFLEKVYENALVYQLKKDHLSYEQQKPIQVCYRDGIVVGDFFADIVVDEKIIIELKAVKTLEKIHYAQVKNYLKATGYRLGLLINFGAEKLQFKRIIL